MASTTESAIRGEFRRPDSVFRAWVSADGSSGYPAAPNRYHLYVSYACPWAHRTMIVRMLKGLERVISMSVVDPIRDERGWRFTEGPGHGLDEVNGFGFLSEAYLATDPQYADRVSVPVLWDRETGRIVSNESSEIIVMLNEAFDACGGSSLDLYPSELRAEIDPLNDQIYDTVNDGVYRNGFAKTQAAYEAAFDRLFATLDELDARLAGRRYLVGSEPTLADWRLFPTLVRFDAVYYCHFRCNRQRLADYAHLPGYLRDLYAVPGVAATVSLDHIKRHYFESHRALNPVGIVPKGPELDLTSPHGREHLS
ncbi:MAG: glutathione S-transferase family protein [Gaiellales bacterium]